MSIAKILVPVTGSPGDDIALSSAFAAAKPFNAHVVAMFVHPDPRPVVSYVYSGVPVSPNIIQQIVDGQKKLADEAERAAKATLTAVAKDNRAIEVAAPAKGDGVTCSFFVRYGFLPDIVSEAARFSDLIVFRPLGPDDHPEFRTAIADTLARTNRPILLATKGQFEAFGRKIVIAWDGHDAASHAAIAALPFLAKAAQVEILVVESSNRAKVPGVANLAEYLSLHGIKTVRRVISRDGLSVSECLLEAAAGSDLLVMGGYGHSHLRETVFGGVTLDVISHHAIPVLLSH